MKILNILRHILVCAAVSVSCSALAQTQSIPGLVIVDKQCEYVLVDWMGAGGGYMEERCVEIWGYQPIDYGPPPPDGGVGMGTIPPAPPNFASLIRVDRRFCKRTSESCVPDWSTRMTAGEIGVDGKPIPGVCQTFVGSASTCASVVGVEAAVNSCVNTNPC